MSTLPPNIQKAFIEALAKLPQRVLLKYESKIKDKPDNIMTKKWFPQRDILSKIFSKNTIHSNEYIKWNSTFF